MEKFIKIYDNIIPPYIVNKIYDITLGEKADYPWFYRDNLTYPPNHPNHSYKPGMQHVLHGPNNLSPYFIQFSQILYEFALKSKILIKDILSINSFLDFPNPTPGPDLPPHVDREYSHWVLLYYINSSKGDTILFKDDKKTEIKRVTPKKGRCIFFDGSIPHCGSISNELSRAVVNFNFLGKNLEKR